MSEFRPVIIEGGLEDITPQDIYGDEGSIVSPPRFPEESAFAPLPATKSPAAQLCHEAANLIDGERNDQHGDRRECHKRIATAWSFWDLIRRPGPETEFDVAVKMGLLKLVRTQTGAYNKDNMRDALGYFSLAGQFEGEEHAEGKS